MVLRAFVIVPIIAIIIAWLIRSIVSSGQFLCHTYFIGPWHTRVHHHISPGANNLQLLVVLGLIGKFTSYMGLVRVCLPLDAVIHII